VKRRGKGGGSVFYHEGKGKWVAQLTWVDPATGRKLKREKHCATRKEAEQALAQMVAEQARGLLMDPSRLTTRDFALEYLRRLEREGLMIQPPKFRHFYPASRVMSCMLCPSASSITSFGVR
jgi:hypothetical protein